jgi:glycosyltransferase involved in cell wall biosynthesis
VHDLIFLRRPQDYDRSWLALTRLLLPRVMSRAAAIACDSRATRDDVVKRLGLPRRKTLVIYPGVDGLFTGATASSPLPYPYVLCLGPWARRKNLEVVVRAFASLARVHGDTRLVITGGPAPGVQSYAEEELTRLLPEEMRDRLVLPRFIAREALAQWVGGASVLAYPSLDEGFGLPPLEAMAAGVPVVVADTPAVVEATSGAALIAPKQNPAAWAECLSLVLDRPQVAQRLREVGLRHSARFTWGACASSFLQLYRRVARASRRKQSA